MKKILTDIMGTTSPNSFVKTLMRDFREKGASYIARASPQALRILDQIREETGLETGEEIIQYVFGQIDQRNLKPEYLALSGEVNVDGYNSGRIQGDFFSDVPIAFGKWKQNGKEIFVYSNGSEESQIAMFRTATQGDLSKYVSKFFDTAKVGSKYESDSYKKISDEIKTSTAEILFLSDLERELEAADKAECNVKLVIRDGNKPVENPDRYNAVRSLEEI